jgi:hypothetical protein
MCDYSLKHVKSRAANVGDKLITRNFGTGTSGFAAVDDPTIAVCLLPGTEIAFDAPVKINGSIESVFPTTARFKQVNKDQPHMHHDTLQFADGRDCLLTFLLGGQCATVIQMPAKPKDDAEREEQRRVEVVA